MRLVAQRTIHSQIFLSVNSCRYSQSWLLKRLREKIEEMENNRQYGFDNSSTLEVNIVELGKVGSGVSKRTDTQSLLDEFKSKYDSDEIKNNHLIVCLNINDYDLESLEQEIIKDLWEKIKEEADSNKWFILLLKREQEWEEDYPTQLDEVLVKLPPANLYENNNLEGLICTIACNLSYTFRESSNTITEDLLKKIREYCDQKAAYLIFELCKLFGCPQPKEFVKKWNTLESDKWKTNP